MRRQWGRQWRCEPPVTPSTVKIEQRNKNPGKRAHTDPCAWLWWKVGPGEVARVSITQQGAQPQHIVWYSGSEAVRTAEPVSLCFLPLCFILQCHNKWAANPKVRKCLWLTLQQCWINPRGFREEGLASKEQRNDRFHLRAPWSKQASVLLLPGLGPKNSESCMMKTQTWRTGIVFRAFTVLCGGMNRKDSSLSKDHPPTHTHTHIVSIRKHSARKYTPPVFIEGKARESNPSHWKDYSSFRLIGLFRYSDHSWETGNSPQGISCTDWLEPNFLNWSWAREIDHWSSPGCWLHG